MQGGAKPIGIIHLQTSTKQVELLNISDMGLPGKLGYGDSETKEMTAKKSFCNNG